MADEKYFQAVSGQWGWNRLATTDIDTDVEKVDFGPESITFGSNRTNVGYIQDGRAYLREGIWNSYVEVMDKRDDPWHPYLMDVTPVVAFADPSYILEEGKEIVYHNSVKGTQLVGSNDEGYLIELGEREFKDFANTWNGRHCEGWVGQTPPQDLPIGTWAYPPVGTLMDFDYPDVHSFRTGNTIWPPLKNKGLSLVDMSWDPVRRKFVYGPDKHYSLLWRYDG